MPTISEKRAISKKFLGDIGRRAACTDRLFLLLDTMAIGYKNGLIPKEEFEHLLAERVIEEYRRNRQSVF